MSITASMNGTELDVNLSASGDSATISPLGSSISVTGQSSASSGVKSIKVTGTNTGTVDTPNQSVTFGGSGGTITLQATAGAPALNVSGVTSVNFSKVTVNATSGDINVAASETTSTANPGLTPNASVTV